MVMFKFYWFLSIWRRKSGDETYSDQRQNYISYGKKFSLKLNSLPAEEKKKLK